jgi:hypothetical protein
MKRRYDRNWLLEFAGASDAGVNALRHEVEVRVHAPAPFVARQVPSTALRDNEAQRIRALQALDRLAEDDLLSDEEADALEAVIIPIGRPALIVEGEDFRRPVLPALLPVWERRDALRPAIRASGRIETPGLAPLLPYCGTGFLVTPSLMMTNRHVVAAGVGRQESGRWTVNEFARPTVDFNACLGAGQPVRASIVGIAYVHPVEDLALIEIEGENLPQPVPLAATMPSANERLCVTIGHPALDSRCPVPVQLQVFENVFDVKRLAPGFILNDNPALGSFEHDCSTLGGNSGSGVFVLDGSTCGLHHSGTYLVTNWAIALTRLAPALLDILR